jgi:hypothetical protein
MLKGQDVVVLLKLAGKASSSDWSLRSLADELSFDPMGVQRALKRLAEADLYEPGLRRVNLSQSEEFLGHAVPYLFPVQLGGEVRGVPTAWAASPLSARLAPQSDLPPVWPYEWGHRRGFALNPLHAVVPKAAAADHALGELLALVDAIRLGDARVRALATELLSERLEAELRP